MAKRKNAQRELPWMKAIATTPCAQLTVQRERELVGLIAQLLVEAAVARNAAGERTRKGGGDERQDHR